MEILHGKEVACGGNCLFRILALMKMTKVGCTEKKSCGMWV
jgi:hypothetical protein